MSPCSPYNCFIRFRRSDIEGIDDNAEGVYGFWYNKRCLYIGKTQNRSIKERLMDYWNGRSHNPYLQLWIDVCREEIKIAYSIRDDSKTRHSLERYYIRRFSPLTNKTN